MNQEEPKPLQESDKEIESQKFDLPMEQKSFGEGSLDTLNAALDLVKMGMVEVIYGKDSNQVTSVTVQSPLGYVMFYSKRTEDIDKFMKVKMPE